MINNNEHIAEIEKNLSESWADDYTKSLNGCKSAHNFLEKLVKENYGTLIATPISGSDEWNSKEELKTEIHTSVMELVEKAKKCLHEEEIYVGDEKFVETEFDRLVTNNKKAEKYLKKLKNLDDDLKSFYEKYENKLNQVDAWLNENAIDSFSISEEDRNKLEEYEKTFGDKRSSGSGTKIYNAEQYFKPDMRGYLREPYYSEKLKSKVELKTTNKDSLSSTVIDALKDKTGTMQETERKKMAKKALKAFISNVEKISEVQKKFLQEAPKIIGDACSVVETLPNNNDKAENTGKTNYKSTEDTKNSSWKNGVKPSDRHSRKPFTIGEKPSNQKNLEGSNKKGQKTSESNKTRSATSTPPSSPMGNKTFDQKQIDELMKLEVLNKDQKKTLQQLLSAKQYEESNLTPDEDQMLTHLLHDQGFKTKKELDAMSDDEMFDYLDLLNSY